MYIVQSDSVIYLKSTVEIQIIGTKAKTQKEIHFGLAPHIASSHHLGSVWIEGWRRRRGSGGE